MKEKDKIKEKLIERKHSEVVNIHKQRKRRKINQKNINKSQIKKNKYMSKNKAE